MGTDESKSTNQIRVDSRIYTRLLSATQKIKPQTKPNALADWLLDRGLAELESANFRLVERKR